MSNNTCDSTVAADAHNDNNQQPTTILDVDADSFLVILSFLGGKSLLFNTALVCKHFYEHCSSESLWRERCLQWVTLQMNTLTSSKLLELETANRTLAKGSNSDTKERAKAATAKKRLTRELHSNDKKRQLLSRLPPKADTPAKFARNFNLRVGSDDSAQSLTWKRLYALNAVRWQSTNNDWKRSDGDSGHRCIAVGDIIFCIAGENASRSFEWYRYRRISATSLLRSEPSPQPQPSLLQYINSETMLGQHGYSSDAVIWPPIVDSANNMADHSIYVMGGSVNREPQSAVTLISLHSIFGGEKSVPDDNGLVQQLMQQQCPPMPIAMYGHCCVSLADRIVVIGGTNGYTRFHHVYYYFPQRQQWVSTNRFCLPPNEPRCFARAVVLRDWLYVIGGFDGQSVRDTMLAIPVAAFTPSQPAAATTESEATNRQQTPRPKNCWHLKAPLLQRRSNFGCVVMHDRIFVFGGTDGVSVLNSIDEYNPNTDQWRRMTRTSGGNGYETGFFDFMFDRSDWLQQPRLKNFECVVSGDCMLAIGGTDYVSVNNKKLYTFDFSDI